MVKKSFPQSSIHAREALGVVDTLRDNLRAVGQAMQQSGARKLIATKLQHSSTMTSMSLSRTDLTPLLPPGPVMRTTNRRATTGPALPDARLLTSFAAGPVNPIESRSAFIAPAMAAGCECRGSAGARDAARVGAVRNASGLIESSCGGEKVANARPYSLSRSPDSVRALISASQSLRHRL